MCGIVGTVGTDDVLTLLVDGLRRLEYRGYDSAGIAVIDDDGTLVVRKRAGKLAALTGDLGGDSPEGRTGLGHTRWATHGAPNEQNAHPHVDCKGRVAVAHNGIIENHDALRAELEARGHRFASDTDTEVIAHLIEDALDRGPGAAANPPRPPDAGDAPAKASRGAARDSPAADALAAAVRQAVGRLEGAYALGVVSSHAPGVLVAARHLSPMIVGVTPDAAFLASDVAGLLGRTRRVAPLGDGEVAVLTPGGLQVVDARGERVMPQFLDVTWTPEAAEKGGYPNFVRKEIDEQPAAVSNTLRGRVTGTEINVPELDALDLDRVRRVHFVAAGTSYYAGLVAARLLEGWARVPAEAAVASEFRYGYPVLDESSLVVLISQSGETADTMAAFRMARDAGAATMAVTNVVGSSVARGANATMYLRVGPEIGVVATKTFAGQLALLSAMAGDVARRRGAISGPRVASLAAGLMALPGAIRKAIDLDAAVAPLAGRLVDARVVLFVGRGLGHPVAMEAALKMKEISYLPAEGYPAGELKHGPIALIEAGTPVVVFAPPGVAYEKTLSNIEEVKSRGAHVIAVAAEGDRRVAALADDMLPVPAVADGLSPLVSIVPAQLLAYHAALALNRDVDQPRNLAKSVTVE
ncbi:MAG: glutamine--fructose-6-phosphate transaminase (isomerizing) [Anaerolineae bacterium]